MLNDPVTRLSNNTLKNKCPDVLTWIGEFILGKKTIYAVFLHRIRKKIPNCVIPASRPTLLRNSYPMKIYDLMCYCLLSYVFKSIHGVNPYQIVQHATILCTIVFQRPVKEHLKPPRRSEVSPARSVARTWGTSHPGWPQKVLIGNSRFNR